MKYQSNKIEMREIFVTFYKNLNFVIDNKNGNKVYIFSYMYVNWFIIKKTYF